MTHVREGEMKMRRSHSLLFNADVLLQIERSDVGVFKILVQPIKEISIDTVP